MFSLYGVDRCLLRMFLFKLCTIIFSNYVSNKSKKFSWWHRNFVKKILIFRKKKSFIRSFYVLRTFHFKLNRYVTWTYLQVTFLKHSKLELHPNQSGCYIRPCRITLTFQHHVATRNPWTQVGNGMRRHLSNVTLFLIISKYCHSMCIFSTYN